MITSDEFTATRHKVDLGTSGCRRHAEGLRTVSRARRGRLMLPPVSIPPLGTISPVRKPQRWLSGASEDRNPEKDEDGKPINYASTGFPEAGAGVESIREWSGPRHSIVERLREHYMSAHRA